VTAPTSASPPTPGPRARTRARTPARARGERGFVTAWTVALAVCCWALVGLALDGGRALRARSDAYGAAASAARAGAQAIDERAAVLGDVRLDEAAARRAALDYVADRGFSGGSVRVEGLEVTVTISDRTDLAILPVASVPYRVTATARAVQGAGAP
jgi:Flp pilus assembly protein TadG